MFAFMIICKILGINRKQQQIKKRSVAEKKPADSLQCQLGLDVSPKGLWCCFLGEIVLHNPLQTGIQLGLPRGVKRQLFTIQL